MRFTPLMAAMDAIANAIIETDGLEVIDKEWGTQYRNPNLDTDEYQFILCHIDNGASSIHRHKERHNTFYLLKGGLDVLRDCNTDYGPKICRMTDPGISTEVIAGVWHQFVHFGNSPTVVLETYTLAPGFDKLSEPEDDIERIDPPDTI